MNDKKLTHNDFLQRLDIRDVLLDAGYRQNRRFGLRLSSFIRTDSEGKRIRGDKFVITQHGKCCCQPPRQKEYNVVSFIKEHPHLFAEYHEGINPDRLVELVCYRLLHYPIPEQETRTGQPQRDTRPFDIADYNIQKESTLHLVLRLRGGTMIKVKTLTGKEIEIDIEPTDTIDRIKERVEEKEGIPPVQQRLTFDGKQMAGDKTAQEYKGKGGYVLHLMLSLRGRCLLEFGSYGRSLFHEGVALV